ncbi:response regulator transcription factor [Azospirillum sp.]|uniref:response regulator transcription factor n=1 Tax=Azospirillum sp. TaxID=34012 RepID=UPI002D732D29|nr:response regulator transcription factor [Azospirillum sp.]HYD67169.1 response regulator transcription factor [Azospirillum sp.]
MARILVADDEPEIRQLVAEYLGLHGFAVTTAADGAEARRLLSGTPPDLAVLDIAMPGEDGLSLARFAREQHDIGIVMLTAAGTPIDRIVGLEVGADDYMAKPFEPAELEARIVAVLRRRMRLGVRAPDGTVRVGRFHFHQGQRRVVDGSGAALTLSATEAELLGAFVANPGRVLSRDELLDLAPPRGDEPFDRSIDNRVARLRRKIEVDPAKPDVIKTVRGAGYVFAGT